jgi:hypothetical protein
MSSWTAEDFKFIRTRMEELQAEEAEILAKSGSELSQTTAGASGAASDFSAINERVKTLERDGALMS